MSLVRQWHTRPGSRCPPPSRLGPWPQLQLGAAKQAAPCLSAQGGPAVARAPRCVHHSGAGVSLAPWVRHGSPGAPCNAGHALQVLLTSQVEPQVSGGAGIEDDAIEFASQVGQPLPHVTSMPPRVSGCAAPCSAAGPKRQAAGGSWLRTPWRGICASARKRAAAPLAHVASSWRTGRCATLTPSSC